MDSLFSHWPRGEAPGAVVAVVRDGRTLHLKSHGLANLETGAPISARTPFRLASLTKQFTAVSVMLLRERGALDYDDPASKFLPAFSAHARGVTVRHLLQHTSGLADYETQLLGAGAIDVDYPRSSSLGASRYEPSTRDVVELVCARPLRFAPGDEWEYSNSGYAALALIVEKVSDRPFSQFLEEQFFRPLGMRDSRLCETARPNIAGCALSYTREGAGFRDVDYTPMNAVYGQDGIYSTAEDMTSWCCALGGGALLNDASLREAFSSGVLNVGAKAGYGLGWFVGNTLGLRCVSHTGSWGGFRNLIAHFPEQKLTALVLSNFDEFDDVARSAVACRLSTIHLSGEMTFRPLVSLAPDALQRYEGRYEFGGGQHFDVKLEGDALRVSSQGLFPVRLVPESEVKFFVASAEGDTYFFKCDSEGRVLGVTRHLSLFGHCRDAYTTAIKLA